MGGQVSIVKQQEDNFKENSPELGQSIKHHIDGPNMLISKTV